MALVSFSQTIHLADKARADIVCDGKTDAAAINAAVAQIAAARGGKLEFFPGTYIVDEWTANLSAFKRIFIDQAEFAVNEYF